MADKIPAPTARAIDAVDEKVSTVEEHLEGHFDAIRAHRAEIDELKAKVAHIMEHLAHILPDMKD